MDIKFQPEPQIVEIKTKDLVAAIDWKKVPKDENFLKLYMRYMTGDGVVLEQTILDVEQIKPFSDEALKNLSENHVVSKVFDIRHGRKPEIMLYWDPESEKYVMSDDYAAFRAYLSLGWKKVPASVMVEVEGEK